MRKKPTVLMILDGYGLSDKTEGNAAYEAKTPVLDSLKKIILLLKAMPAGWLSDFRRGRWEIRKSDI